VKKGGAWALALSFGVLGCASAPEPVPFRGAAPARIAILPLRSSGGVPISLADGVESGAHIVLRDHGYEAIPADVVGRVEGASGEADRALLVELVRVFAVDAVLIPELRALDGATVSGESDIALRWTFVDVADGAVQWTREEVATPGQVTARHLGSPGSRFEADPFFQDEPQVGRGGQTWVTEVRARTPEQLAEVLVGSLVARLPVGPAARR
jgi:hypothetical protein